MGWMNVGSFVLGLIAWILPVVALLQPTKQAYGKWVVLSVMSLSACAISLCLQIFYTHHKVQVEDWSALMDTMGAVSFAAAVLLLVTLVLNVGTLLVYRGRTVR